MELRVLQYFLAVVREENITRAAEVLHVTQPTLSRQMAQLEDELGVQLFMRGKRLQLTDAGVMLRRRAEEVVSLMHKIESEFEERSDVGGVVSIGSGGLMALQFVTSVMDSFRRKYPAVQYQLYANSAEYVKERLEQGLLDFGILMEPIDVTKFDYIRMDVKERFGLLVSASHPLARRECITRDDLLGIPLIISERASLQRELASWMGDVFQRLDIFATHNMIADVLALVDRGIASAITVEGAVAHFDGRRMKFMPFNPELSTTSVLAWKKFQPNFSVAGKFLEHLKSMQQTHAFASDISI